MLWVNYSISRTTKTLTNDMMYIKVYHEAKASKVYGGIKGIPEKVTNITISP